MVNPIIRICLEQSVVYIDAEIRCNMTVRNKCSVVKENVYFRTAIHDIITTSLFSDQVIRLQKSALTII